MTNLEIKTVKQLVDAYNTNLLFGGWITINNLFSDGNSQWTEKSSYHLDKFEDLSYGTQLSLVAEFMFSSDRMPKVPIDYGYPNARKMLDEYLNKIV